MADAERNGWIIVGEIRDADEKGWNDQRPGLLELYQRCREGSVDVVAVWSVSRLARSVRILEAVAHELERIGVALYSHEEPHAGQPLYRQILGAVAEQDTRDKAAHVRRAVHAKMANGVHHGVVPWGYAQPNPKKPLVLCEKTAPIVRWMYEQRSHGIGPAAIALDLTQRGIPTPRGLRAWHTATVSHIIGHIAHRGAVRAGDDIREGSHPEIVSPDLWQRAQLHPQPGRRGPRCKTVTSWLDGLTEHACGQPMYLNQPTPSHDYALLRCRDSGRGWRHAGAEPCPYSPRCVRVARIEPLVWEATRGVLEMLLDPESIAADAHARYQRDTPVADAMRREALERQKRAAERRSRAEGLYLSGVRDRAWFDVEDVQAMTEMAAAERVLTSLPMPPNADEIDRVWSSLRTMRALLSRVQDRDRATVLRSIGMAVVMPSGNKLPGKGGPDAGRVAIRVRPELEAYFANNLHYPHDSVLRS